MLDATKDPTRILKKHPALLRQVGESGAVLTLEGRLFVCMLLVQENRLTSEQFGQITSNEQDGQLILRNTCAMLANVADKWLEDHKGDFEIKRHELYAGTNLTLEAVGVLMYVFNQAQRNQALSPGR